MHTVHVRKQTRAILKFQPHICSSYKGDFQRVMLATHTKRVCLQLALFPLFVGLLLGSFSLNTFPSLLWRAEAETAPKHPLSHTLIFWAAKPLSVAWVGPACGDLIGSEPRTARCAHASACEDGMDAMCAVSQPVPDSETMMRCRHSRSL